MEHIVNLTIFQVADLREKFLEHIAAQKKIVIDLKELQECDTAGMQLLVSVAKTAKDTGKKFQLKNVPARFIETASAVGLDVTIFSVV